MMEQSRRIRVFAVGFGIGCILAAGIAFYRFAAERSEPLAPLPQWASARNIEGPRQMETLELALPGVRYVRTWKAENRENGAPVRRHLLRDGEKRFWHVDEIGGGQRIQRADLLEVHGNQGIEYPALLAGLEHNEFEIVYSHPSRHIFIVRLDPFDPLAIERSIRLLKSREPYIIDALPVYLDSHYDSDNDLDSSGSHDRES